MQPSDFPLDGKALGISLWKGTFYTHYHNVNDVLAEVEDGLLAGLADVTERVSGGDLPKSERDGKGKKGLVAGATLLDGSPTDGQRYVFEIAIRRRLYQCPNLPIHSNAYRLHFASKERRAG